MTSANIPDMAHTLTAEQELKALAQAVVDRPWSFACQQALTGFLQEDMPSAREAALRILSGDGPPTETKISRDAKSLCNRPASGGGAQGDVAPSGPASTALYDEEETPCSDS